MLNKENHLAASVSWCSEIFIHRLFKTKLKHKITTSVEVNLVVSNKIINVYVLGLEVLFINAYRGITASLVTQW